MGDEYFDYIVVGAGSGGSTVAGRLAEAGAKVLVLEAGGTDRRPDVLIPAGLPVAYQTSNWKYASEPDPSRNGVAESWPAGKLMGGSGSINATVFVRGNRADFDGWSAAGATGWDYASVLPDFKRMESWAGGADTYRGGSGPIAVDFQSISHPTTEPFLTAAKNSGHSFTADYNGEQQVGVGHIQVNQRRGIRSQASREYLRRLDFAAPPTIRTRAVVTRLLFNGRRVTGVEYVRRGATQLAHATREIILAAGTLATPKLLLLSGIGPKSHLSDVGIDVHTDLPGVGRNLQEHPAVMLRWVSKLPTVNNIGPAEAVGALYQYATQRKGILAACVYQLQVLHKTSASLDAPDIQIGFGCFSTERVPGKDGSVRILPTRQPGLQLTTVFLHPRYRGAVELRSRDPLSGPMIRHHLLGTNADTRDLLSGVREAQRIMGDPALRDYVDGMFEPERSCNSDQDWVDFLREHATYGSHAVGTCAMGGDDDAVVDPQLRVRDVEGLRISDASVMPQVTSGNTNAATMMIGERAAREILSAS